jgi:hypothetical protein
MPLCNSIVLQLVVNGSTSQLAQQSASSLVTIAT